MPQIPSAKDPESEMKLNQIVYEALQVTSPGIENILRVPGKTRGPKCILVVVEGPDMDGRFIKVFGKLEKWKEDWGEEENFYTKLDERIKSLKERADENSKYPEFEEISWANGYASNGIIIRSDIMVGVYGATFETNNFLAELISKVIQGISMISMHQSVQNAIDNL